jgi:squalene synthase HpnC
MLQSDSKTTANSTFFERELALHGPGSPREHRANTDPQSNSGYSRAEANQYCRRFAKQSYENFTVGSWLLPQQLRQDFYNIYAFCRWSDNLADEIDNPVESLHLLDWWQKELTQSFVGQPKHPIMVALQHTIREHELPISLFEDLLAAFRQDQSVLRYETETELMDYCRRSANPVGHLLLRLARAATPTNLALSDKICTALQLANFCQDMSRDAGMNRIYAPRDLWTEHGVNEPMLLARRPTPALRNMLKQWVEETRVLFDAGKPIVKSVPRWLAMDVELFVRGGEAVLAKIERARFDVWSQRPLISKFDKLRILGHAVASRLWVRGGTTDA